MKREGCLNISFSDFCLCPECRSELIEHKVALECRNCGVTYEIQDGTLRLLPACIEPLRERYRKNYEKIATNFLTKNKYKADNVAYRHHSLLKFIGRKHPGKRILDIGSSHAIYLREIQAEFKVAVDIAETYLKIIPASAGVFPILADAESFPFKDQFFDIIIIADILEHLLNPERLVEALAQASDANTRIFVHIPWEENLEPYFKSEFEFAHLRSFNAYTFCQLWHRFYIHRSRFTYPDLRYPLIFKLEKFLPLWFYNALVKRYFFTSGIAEKDAIWRENRLNSLPKGEWILLRLFKPVFRIYEMRLLTNI